jgi:hypothetical protein
MSLTLQTKYTIAANAAIKYIDGPIPELVRYLGSSVTLPDNAANGVISTQIWTAMTAGTITDGTPTTNLLNNTTVSLTVAECQSTISLTPKQTGGDTLTGENLVKANKAQVESIYTAAIEAYIAALIAATPTQSNTLTAGYANFKGATATELGILANTITTTAANRSGNMGEFRCLMHPTAWGYLMEAVARLYSSASGYNISQQGVLSYLGCPIIPVPAATTTSWGGASLSTAFIVHPDGAPLLLGPVQIHGGGMIAASDATNKWIMTGVYGLNAAYQVALTGEILNAAS